MQELDLSRASNADLWFTKEFSLEVTRDDLMHGFVTWFDVEFSQCNRPIMLSTGTSLPRVRVPLCVLLLIINHCTFLLHLQHILSILMTSRDHFDNDTYMYSKRTVHTVIYSYEAKRPTTTPPKCYCILTSLIFHLAFSSQLLMRINYCILYPELRVLLYSMYNTLFIFNMLYYIYLIFPVFTFESEILNFFNKHKHVFPIFLIGEKEQSWPHYQNRIAYVCLFIIIQQTQLF